MLTTLIAWLSLAGAGLAVLGIGIFVFWSLSGRERPTNMEEMLELEATHPYGLGLVRLLFAAKYLLWLAVPHGLLVVYPTEVTPGVLLLTGGAMVGLLALTFTMLLQSFSLSFLARYYGDAGTNEERQWIVRAAEWSQMGMLGSGFESAFHLLVALWALLAGIALLSAGVAPAAGLFGVILGAYGLVAGGYLVLALTLAWPRQRLLPPEPVLLLEVFWFGTLGLLVLMGG